MQIDARQIGQIPLGVIFEVVILHPIDHIPLHLRCVTLPLVCPNTIKADLDILHWWNKIL